MHWIGCLFFTRLEHPKKSSPSASFPYHLRASMNTNPHFSLYPPLLRALVTILCIFCGADFLLLAQMDRKKKTSVTTMLPKRRNSSAPSPVGRDMGFALNADELIEFEALIMLARTSIDYDHLIQTSGARQPEPKSD